MVIDTNYILNKVSELQAEHVYATPDVISEVKDEHSIEYMNQLEYFNKIIIRQPSAKNLLRIRDTCVAMGELGSVSKQDIGVLALTLDILEEFSSFQFTEVSSELQEQYKGVFFDSNEPSKAMLRKKEKEREQQAVRDQEEQDEYMKRFYEKQSKKKNIDYYDIMLGPKTEEPQEVQQEAQEEQIEEKIERTPEKQEKQEENPEKNEEKQDKEKKEKKSELPGWGDWATNADEIANVETEALKSEIGLFTLDNAMQNIALQLGVPLVTPERRQITKIVRYALKCQACCAVFVNMEQVIKYARNKPYYQQLLNDQANNAALSCPECASKGLDRVSCYIKNGQISFSKGRKFFRNVVCNNYCDLSRTKYSMIRNKFLLHPELYEERLLRVVGNKSANKFEFGASVQGAGVERDVEIAYFMRRNRKGIAFDKGVK